MESLLSGADKQNPDFRKQGLRGSLQRSLEKLPRDLKLVNTFNGLSLAWALGVTGSPELPPWTASLPLLHHLQAEAHLRSGTCPGHQLCLLRA